MISTSPFSSLFKSHLFNTYGISKIIVFWKCSFFTFPLIHSHPLWISLLRFRVFPLIVGEFSWFGVNVPRSLSKPDFQKRALFKFESFLNSQVFHSFFVCFTSVCETRKCMIFQCFWTEFRKCTILNLKPFCNTIIFYWFSNGFCNKTDLVFQRSWTISRKDTF